MDDIARSDSAPTSRGLTAGDRVFQRFTLLRQIGRGGMGVVWLARDDRLEADVALKFLPDPVRWDVSALATLRRETRRSRELTHPHIVRVHDIHEDAGAAAIAMEYLSGGSLHQLRGGRTPPVLNCAEITVWLPGLCAALDHAHAQGVVHRDLKPANLLVAADGAVKISDFGIAQPLFETALRVSQWAPSGTLAYMSPQQQFGEPASAADDIYALGATLYELLTGKPPFYTGNLAAQIERRAPDSLVARRQQLGVTGEAIPPAWEETIAACLAKRPEDRPRTAGEVAARLGDPAAATNAASGAGRFLAIYWVTNRRRPAWRKAAMGMLLIVSTALAFWKYQTQRPTGPAFASDATRALAAWNLDGDGQDASGRGLHLVANGTAPVPDRLGRIDRALRFNGRASLHSAEAPELRWSGAEPFTLALWVKPDNAAQKSAVLAASRPARQGEHFWQLSLAGGRLYFHSGGLQIDGPDRVDGTAAVPAGTWSHVLAVHDGRELRLYLNGRETGRAPLGASLTAPVPTAAELSLGYYDKFEAEKFSGELDGVRLWRRALTPGEIARVADPDTPPGFRLTRGTYAETADLSAAISREFGAGARLADWDELRRWHSDDTRAMADELGLVVETQAVLVQRAGQGFGEAARHYFINRFAGRKPDYFLAHDELGGMVLALGSWHSFKAAALVAQPLARPRVEQLRAGEAGAVVRELAAGEQPAVLALGWQREFTRGPGGAAVAEIILRDGRGWRAVCRATGGDTFALALGDATRPQLAREIGATYDQVKFTVVLRRGRMEFRAVSGVGATPLFQEAVPLPDFTPDMVARLVLPGVDSADLTMEK